jgi:hypothetical protein
MSTKSVLANLSGDDEEAEGLVAITRGGESVAYTDPSLTRRRLQSHMARAGCLVLFYVTFRG